MGKATDTMRRAAPARINPQHNIDMKNNGKYKTVTVVDKVKSNTSITPHTHEPLFSTPSRKRKASQAELDMSMQISVQDFALQQQQQQPSTQHIDTDMSNLTSQTNTPISLSRPRKLQKSSNGTPSRIGVTGATWRQSPLYATQKQSTVVKVKALRTSNWSKAMAEKATVQAMRQRSADLNAAEQAKRSAEREKLKANKKRRAENEQKSQVVVAITDSKKLKRMNRKQLRTIQKR